MPPERIVSEIETVIGLDPGEIPYSKFKTGELSKGRHIARSILKQLNPNFPLLQIGHLTGATDHSTVHHSIKTDTDLCKFLPEYRRMKEGVVSHLKGMGIIFEESNEPE